MGVIVEAIYGWAFDRLSEHWHITGAKLGDAITAATKEDETGGAWLCRAHKLRIDEILDDGMVESWLEHLDEKAGEVSGIQDSLFKSVGNDWHERVRKTRESVTGALQTIWEKTLWYHEVDSVAPLTIRYNAVQDASLTQGDYVWDNGWFPFTDFDLESESQDQVMVGYGGAFRQMSKEQKIRVARVGDWSRFGAV